MEFASKMFWPAFLAFTVVFLCVRGNIGVRNILLLGASYVFIALWGGRLLILLLVVTVLSYGACALLRRLQKGTAARIVLAASIVLLLLPLLTIKLTEAVPFYTLMPQNIFPHWFLAFLFAVGRLGFPLGVSFYTFQAIGTVIDVYRDQTRGPGTPLEHALALAFFPKFVAGPIERTTTLLPQLQSARPLSLDRLSQGIFLIVWGLVLKFCIADRLSPYANQIFTDVGSASMYPLSSPLALTLLIYADFSGYTNIARGIAALLGFDLLENFHLPYFSKTPSEFWRRWHISLSQWVRDYVYIPLGGSRRSLLLTNVNLIATMLVIGAWHGFRSMFLVWGLYHGLLLVLYRTGSVLLEPFPALRRFLAHPLLSIPVFFALTTIGWLVFNSLSFGQFLVILSGIGSAFRQVTPLLRDPSLLTVLAFWVPVVAMDMLRLWRGRDSVPSLQWPFQLLFYYASVYALIFATLGGSQRFLYAVF